MTARRAKRDIQWKMIKLTFGLAVFIGIFALIGLRTAVVDLKYELNKLGDERTELMRMAKLLGAEKEKIYSVENIEKLAMDVGMQAASRGDVIYVKRVPGAAPYKVSGNLFSRDN
jgi:hypothetical protein